MNFREQQLSNNKGEWTVSIEGQEWLKYQQQAEKKMMRQIKIPGFRPNKIPPVLLRKYVSQDVILQEAQKDGLKAGYEFAFSHDSKKLTPITQPRIKIITATQTTLTFKIIFKTTLGTEIKNYTGFNLKKKQAQVSDHEVENLILKRMLPYATFVTDDKVTKNSLVTLDFQGFIKNKPFAGGHTKNMQLLMGTKSMIPNFEQQLLGHYQHDHFKINVTFPDNYIQKNLASQPACFDVTIREIQKVVWPEMNEALSTKLRLPKTYTLAEWKKQARQKITNQKQQEIDEEYLETLCDKIADRNKITHPSEQLKQEADRLTQVLKEKIASQGLKYKSYCRRLGLNEQKIQEMMLSDAKTNLNKITVFDAVSKQENFPIDSNLITKTYSELARKKNLSRKEIKRAIPEKDLIHQIKTKLTADFLINHNQPSAKTNPPEEK